MGAEGRRGSRGTSLGSQEWSGGAGAHGRGWRGRSNGYSPREKNPHEREAIVFPPPSPQKVPFSPQQHIQEWGTAAREQLWCWSVLLHQRLQDGEDPGLVPILWKSSGSCTSTFSLWNMWYSACSQIGGIRLNCRATEYASCNRIGTISAHQPHRHGAGIWAPGPPVPPTRGPYHDLHGAPARRAPVHGHPLVDDVGHGAHRLCQRKGEQQAGVRAQGWGWAMHILQAGYIQTPNGRELGVEIKPKGNGNRPEREREREKERETAPQLTRFQIS